MHKRILAAGAGAAAAALAMSLTACGTSSVVRSAPVSASVTADGLGKARPYLTYYLPQTIFIATVKAAGGGADKDDKTVSATATVNNAITINDKVVKPPAKPEAGGDDEPDCKKAPTAYEKLRLAHDEYIGHRKIDLEQLVVLAAGPLTAAKDQAAATKALTAFKDAIAKDNERVVAANKLLVSLKTVCKQSWAVEVATEVIADREAAYFLVLQDDEMSSDQVSVKVDSHGLLTSISTTADDKTGEGLASLVKSLGTVIGAANPSTAGGVVSLQAVKSVSGPHTFAARSFKDTFLKELAALLVMPTPKPLDPLPKPPANPFRFTLAEVADKDVALGTTGFHLDTRCGAAPGTMTRPGHIDAAQSGGAGFDGTEGVVMPFPRACTVRAYETNAADAPTWSVVALDSKHPTEAYLLRTRLVKRGSSYAFKDGQMTEVSSDLPSTFAAGAALPGTIIGGFFSGIVSGIQGPQSVYKTQADLLNAKASVYDAQAALLKAQTAAKTDDKTDSNATEAN